MNATTSGVQLAGGEQNLQPASLQGLRPRTENSGMAIRMARAQNGQNTARVKPCPCGLRVASSFACRGGGSGGRLHRPAGPSDYPPRRRPTGWHDTAPPACSTRRMPLGQGAVLLAAAMPSTLPATTRSVARHVARGRPRAPREVMPHAATDAS